MMLTLKPDQVILPLVDENVQHRTIQGIEYQHPETVADVELVMKELHSEPYYWRLPGQFEGRKFSHNHLNVGETINPIRCAQEQFSIPACGYAELLNAYGGKLKYAIYFEAREETGFATYNPQIIIRGGLPTHTRMIVRHVAAPLIGQLTRHDIEMTEHEWKYYGDDPRVARTVNREDFMDVLYNVHYILIKASHGSFMRKSRDKHT
uniref:Laminin subunit alpha-2 n=1 Tax=Sphaerodactylus townsendi TaxID=933632 RepID=A0ACB8GCJ6_9SAUR